MKGNEQKTLEQRIAEAVREKISIEPYNPVWPDMFEKEAGFLLKTLPFQMIKKIEHFGSTAVPGLSAKGVIDILVEVSSLEETKARIVPLLETLGYEYFWRTDIEPPYVWFIKRNPDGGRACHIHMVEADSKQWDCLYFRDYLREFPDEAKRYEDLKHELAEKFKFDRVSYTEGKTAYITGVTKKAKQYYKAL